MTGFAFQDRLTEPAEAPPPPDFSHLFARDKSANGTRTSRDGSPDAGIAGREVAGNAKNFSAQPNVRDNILTLHFGDPGLDRQLSAAANYNTIVMDTPPGVSVRHWVDDKGYYFWFQNGNDNGAHHYFPAFAKQITVNGKAFDLEAQQLKVNETYAAQAGGFQNYAKNSNAIDFASRLSKLPAQSLDVMEKNLTQSVKNSTNPYFKIYLADIYLAQAMQPVIQQARVSPSVDVNNPRTLNYLNAAIVMLKAAQSDSINNLGGIKKVLPDGITEVPLNQYPQGNVVMPLSPYDIYAAEAQDRQQKHLYQYSFWGGSLHQAHAREVSLTMLRDMIARGALPRFALP